MSLQSSQQLFHRFGRRDASTKLLLFIFGTAGTASMISSRKEEISPFGSRCEDETTKQSIYRHGHHLSNATTSFYPSYLSQNDYRCFCQSSLAGTTSSDESIQDDVQQSSKTSISSQKIQKPSWIRRNILVPLRIMSLPLPRIITKLDPDLTMSPRHIRQRHADELKMRQVLEQAVLVQNDPDKLQKLGEELFRVAYGNKVTPQIREDFLVRYGCTGWTSQIIDRLIGLCYDRGIVEIGAGHGQWSRALNDAYNQSVAQEEDTTNTKQNKKQFDFVLAYDDHSNLPLNVHIYNQYTKPHHDYFGIVHKIQSKLHLSKILRSWTCRGRALLLVYPPPGSMAINIIQEYVNAANENDTIIYVGEGRGGANGSDELFDYFEKNGENWILFDILDVLKPPGNKGYEKLFILKKNLR